MHTHHLENTIYRQLSASAGLHFVDLRKFYISNGILKKIPSIHARSRRWIPMIFNKRRVILIIDDPFVAFSLSREELWEFFGPPYDREFGFVMAAPSALDGVLEEKYPLESC